MPRTLTGTRTSNVAPSTFPYQSNVSALMLFYKVCGGGENAVAVRPFSACDAPELVSVSACGGIRGLEPAAAAALCCLQVTLLSSGESELTAFERAGRADQSGPSASLPQSREAEMTSTVSTRFPPAWLCCSKVCFCRASFRNVEFCEGSSKILPEGGGCPRRALLISPADLLEFVSALPSQRSR